MYSICYTRVQNTKNLVLISVIKVMDMGSVRLISYTNNLVVGIYRVCVEVSGVSESLRLPFDLENPLSIHGLLYIWTDLLSIFSQLICPHEAQDWDKITPWGWIFRIMTFLILKSSQSDVSYEGPKLILSSLEFGN